MAETQETIADIIAEMRNEGRTGPSDCLEWVGTKMCYYAGLFEAALKRERGDCAKLREAWEVVLDALKKAYATAEVNRVRLADSIDVISAALSAPPSTGKWKNGREYEYEYAYCSECGRMQWAGWDSHRQAEENVESFAEKYRFCPGCGAKMEGGVYVK